MACVAIGEDNRIVVVHVARCAGSRRMPSCQGQSGGRVVERRRSPAVRSVALGTDKREAACLMVGIFGAGKILRVTIAADRRKRSIAPACVARVAGNGPVPPRQRESGLVMIERCGPVQRDDLVALRAVGTESGSDVVRVDRIEIAGAMASNAGRWRSGVPVGGNGRMAIGTTEGGMSSQKGKSCHLVTLHHIGHIP